MGAECVCLGQEAIKAEALSKEIANSKFFYFSDPQLVVAFQDKLVAIQKNLEQQKRLRETLGKASDDQRFWNEPSRLSRK